MGKEYEQVVRTKASDRYPHGTRNYNARTPIWREAKENKRYPFSLLRLAKTKELANTKHQQACPEMGTATHCWRLRELGQGLWRGASPAVKIQNPDNEDKNCHLPGTPPGEEIKLHFMTWPQKSYTLISTVSHGFHSPIHCDRGRGCDARRWGSQGATLEAGRRSF